MQKLKQGRATRSGANTIVLGLVSFLSLVSWGQTMPPPVKVANPPPAKTATTVAAGENLRKSVFGVGIMGNRHNLKAGDGNEIIGNAMQVALGGGYIDEKWFLTGSVDILLGPYEPARGKQINVDYLGTGATAWWGYSAQTLNLRSDAGSYGFAFGISYADYIGRAIGRNRQEAQLTSNEDLVLLDNYVMRVTEFAVTPGIFFSWLKPGRQAGNSPELLRTRIEGYLFSMGVSFPILASYSAKYDTRSNEGQIPDEDESQEEQIASETIREKGRLRGYSILIGLTAFLGT